MKLTRYSCYARNNVSFLHITNFMILPTPAQW
nr:MAG TPA: hypothetical protein [Caudoviricetes sp.]